MAARSLFRRPPIYTVTTRSNRATRGPGSVSTESRTTNGHTPQSYSKLSPLENIERTNARARARLRTRKHNRDGTTGTYDSRYVYRYVDGSGGPRFPNRIRPSRIVNTEEPLRRLNRSVRSRRNNRFETTPSCSDTLRTYE